MLYPRGGRVRRRRRHRSAAWDSPDRGGLVRLPRLVRAEEERAAVRKTETEREDRLLPCVNLHISP